jgi:hypothetical protein
MGLGLAEDAGKVIAGCWLSEDIKDPKFEV